MLSEEWRKRYPSKKYSLKSCKKDYSGRLVTIDHPNPLVLFNRYLDREV